MTPRPDPAIQDELARVAALAIAIALNMQDEAMRLVREGFGYRPKFKPHIGAILKGVTIQSQIPFDQIFASAIKIYGFNLTPEQVNKTFLQCYPIFWEQGLLPRDGLHAMLAATAKSGVIHELIAAGLRATFTNVTSHNPVMQDLLLAVTHEEKEKGSKLTKQDVIGPFFWKILQRLLKDSPTKRDLYYGLFYSHFTAIVEKVISIDLSLLQQAGARLSDEEARAEIGQVATYVFAGFEYHLPAPKD
jgi:hypothetical protein